MAVPPAPATLGQPHFITLTFDPGEQTRQAIDMGTAMKIYESKHLTEVGRQVVVSIAGAKKIIIESKQDTVGEED